MYAYSSLEFPFQVSVEPRIVSSILRMQPGQKCSLPGRGGGGGEGGALPSNRLIGMSREHQGDSPLDVLLGCAAGWGRIFTTGVTIMGLHFQ